MKELKILLYRNWLEFKKKYLSYIFLWSLLPMMFYLLLTLPLSEYIKQVPVLEISYESWALPGIWICSSSLFAYVYCFSRLRNLIIEDNQLEKYLKAPISNGQFLFSLLITSIFFGIIQLSISMFITLNLGIGTTISNMDLFLIFFNIFFLIIFFSILGLLLSFYIKDNLFSGLVIFIIFIFLSFSLGTINPIPIEANNFFELIKKLPLYEIVLNTQRVIGQKSINVTPIVTVAIINSILFVIVLAISYKKFRK